MSADNAERRATTPDYGAIEEVSAGIDWISCSLPAIAKDRWVWANECVVVLQEIAENGYAIRDWGLLGYKGIQVGGSFTGNRPDGSYLQLAGKFAHTYFQRVFRADLHISRLDLAVTVKFHVMPRSLGEEAYRAAVEADKMLSSSRHRKLWYMQGSDGGYTLYIGSPSSEQRGRLYNKEIQSEQAEYAKCWRYEVVYRNTRAMDVFEELCEVGEQYSATLCSLLVGTWYKNRGVAVPWVATNYQVIRPLHKEAPSDAAKKLKWLETQVKPAVRWLKEKGLLNQALYALGLDEG